MRGLFEKVIGYRLSVIGGEWPVARASCPCLMGGTPMPHAVQHRRHAFTLVEIALAMLVFSLGILTFFALLSLGINQDLEGQYQTRVAEFADSTLRGLRAVSDHLSETADGNEWTMFWRDFMEGRTNIIVTAGGTNGIWQTAPVVWGNNSTHSITFENYPLRGGEPVVSHILRYRMLVSLEKAMDDSPRDNLAIVTLRVWEGDKGQNDDRDALILYTQFIDRGAVR